MSRAQHVAETLPFSARENPDPDVEFVLVDYDSGDGLDEWARRFGGHPTLSGRFTYVRVSGPRGFHMAHAKNVAHRAAAGEILVNLDADNFATRLYTQKVRSAFAAGYDLARFAPDDLRVRGGGSGRIAVRRGVYDRLTGYDEAMRGWGYEDTDFVERARLVGAKVYHVTADLLRLIRHDDALRLGRTANKDRHETEARNRAHSRANIARNHWAANEGRDWGRA